MISFSKLALSTILIACDVFPLSHTLKSEDKDRDK